MERNSNYIGTHLVMDITSYDANLLRDEGRMSEYIRTLIRMADMTCLVPPRTFTFPYDGEYTKFLEALRAEGTTSPLINKRLDILDYNKTEGSGITGFAILAESHVAVHSFPEKNDPFMSICLYSCKEFDPISIINYSNTYWDVKTNNTVIMTRFVDKPQEIEQKSYSFPKLTVVK